MKRLMIIALVSVLAGCAGFAEEYQRQLDNLDRSPADTTLLCTESYGNTICRGI